MARITKEDFGSIDEVIASGSSVGGRKERRNDLVTVGSLRESFKEENGDDWSGGAYLAREMIDTRYRTDKKLRSKVKYIKSGEEGDKKKKGGNIFSSFMQKKKQK